MDLEFVEKIYSNSISKHGPTSEGVGWGTEEAHRLRHDKLFELMRCDPEPYCLNDLGCGYGSFFEYLVEQKSNITKYRGYDISEPMIQAAKERNVLNNNAKVELLLNSRLDKVSDYTVASGIFNVRLENTEEKWLDYILNTLMMIDKFSRKGFGFNLLTSYVDWKNSELYYADPTFFFDFCKKNFSKKVAIYHDYPLWEWTMIVRK